MRPKVSIIVPFFNSAATLPRSLNSLCRQQLQDIEIICVDDASTDSSVDVVKEYACHDSRVHLVRLETNRGPGAARNEGIRQASGDYIGFVDADDFVADDFYERLLNIAIREGADIAKGLLYTVSADGQGRTLLPAYDINDAIKICKGCFCAGFTSAIYKRDFLLSKSIFFPEGIIHFEDPPFAISAALSSKRIVFDSSAVYLYVTNPNSLTKNPSKRHVLDHIKATRIVLDFLQSKAVQIPEVWVVKEFLRNQLLAWNNREDVSPEIKAVALEAIETLGLNEELGGDYLRWKRAHELAVTIAKLRGRVRTNI